MDLAEHSTGRTSSATSNSEQREGRATRPICPDRHYPDRQHIAAGNLFIADAGNNRIRKIRGFTLTFCGDCTNDGRVTVDELLTMVNIALGDTPISECEIGDMNGDRKITVDEILTALNLSLTACPLTPAEQGCLNSGGAVTTAMCCASTGDFPDTCGIGACGCPPDASHEVRTCECGAGKCFDGSECVSQVILATPTA